MNSATENSTTSTRIETRTRLAQELLLKVLSNPEMPTLLTILSRQLPVDKDDENRNSPLGAKNNDSHSKKQAIVIFYTIEYRKCGNSN